MDRKGMTLLEVMFATAILTIVMGTLYSLSIGLGDTARVQQAMTTAHLEARTAIQRIVRELRQSSGFSLSALPASTLSYQVAADIDGNGSAVDVGGRLELSAVRILTRDYEDVNGDDFAEDQLVLIDGETVRVLANGLLPDEDVNGNGVLDTGEDTNENGVLDHGIWFEPWAAGSRAGIQVNVQARRTDRRGHVLMADLLEVVVPRNN